VVLKRPPKFSCGSNWNQ